jgi:spore coat polysaccharide biosynthesis protein SpsF
MICGVIQARFGASRLPGKTLMDISGRSLLGWTILAVQACLAIERTVVVTTARSQDDAVAAEARRYGAETFRGDEEDVLGRYLAAAEALEMETLVRVSGDSPLFSPWVCHGIVEEYLAARVDYASNACEETFPYGTQVEVFSRATLTRSLNLATRTTDHEHVTPAIRRHWKVFRCLSIVAPKPVHRGHYRLCVDTLQDYETVCELFDAVPHPPDLPPELIEVVGLLDRSPHLTGHMQPGSQRYSTSLDATHQLPTIELAMSYRDDYTAASRSRTD